VSEAAKAGCTNEISANDTEALGGRVVAEVSIGIEPEWAHASRVSKFLNFFFELLDRFDVRYCVLHAWETLPDELPSDLDISAHPDDRPRLTKVIRSLKTAGFQPVQCLHYGVEAYRFVFCWEEDSEFLSIPVDVTFEHVYGGVPAPRVEELIEERQRFRNFWIAGPRSAFLYLLAKRIWKGGANAEQADQLALLARNLGMNEAYELARRLLTRKAAREVIAACLNGSLNKTLRERRLNPWRKAILNHPLELLRYFWSESVRLASRFTRPVGMLLAGLGPDGSGKSTLLERMASEFAEVFSRTQFYHWRPQLLAPRANTSLIVNPHAQKPRKALPSTLFAIGFVVDYWVGFLFRIRPSMVRASLVIFDRYFYDVMVDPKRSRFGGPVWVAKALCKLVPSPDLLMLFDAEETTILSRKPELEMVELRRLRGAYRGLPYFVNRNSIVQTGCDIDVSALRACRVVAEFLSRRFEQRHTAWLAED